MTEIIGKILCWTMAVFFGLGAYGFFPRDQAQAGFAAFMTVLCAVACIGSIVGSFHVYPPSEYDD